MSQHIVFSFDQDLQSVQAKVMRIGSLAETALSDAVLSLETRDVKLAERVRTRDTLIDNLTEEIKVSCAKLLALRAPTAIDLRIVLSVMAIGGNLERIGDYAKNIAKRASVISENPPVSVVHPLRTITDFVVHMISDSLDSYIQRSQSIAESVLIRDQRVDEMYTALFRNMLIEMQEKQHEMTVGMHLQFIAKNIERAGDQATNIAEQTIYLVTGMKPNDDRPKRDMTSYETLRA